MYYSANWMPKYDLEARIQHTKLDSGIYGMPSARLDRMEKPSTPDFKAVFSGLVENFNAELNAPDNLLKDVMSGYNNIDIHDVKKEESDSAIVYVTMTVKSRFGTESEETDIRTTKIDGKWYWED